ncbi:MULTISPECIES: hypothetical protein [Arthrobacter]|uniref:Uncharacterized protein n=1 Tax=Arthrobacter terricola TaxID=2547396 RepID=A0A4R5KAU3_9MICC|nr:MULTISPECIES: hypothetical protein [Arthrobacter]MBT8162960.1 hypothetical protein [Arthrobacter sp. GN70]TDF91635.1 hypothetical protein E1809_20135 [Arthrobacter terricola]
MSQPTKRSRQNTFLGYGFILLSIIGIISGIGQIWSSGKVVPGLTTILFGVVFIVVGVMRLRVKSRL